MIRVKFQDHATGQKAPMPRWAAWLTVAASLVVGVTLFLVAASLALILIPVALIVGAIATWRLRSRLKAAGFGQGRPFGQQPHAKADRVDVIDAEYRVIEPAEPPRR